MYYIIENQIREDGQVNNIIQARQNLNSAMSFFWERCSKMAMTELYPSVAIMVCDQDLRTIDRKIVNTCYKPKEEPIEEVEEE